MTFKPMARKDIEGIVDTIVLPLVRPVSGSDRPGRGTPQVRRRSG